MEPKLWSSITARWSRCTTYRLAAPSQRSRAEDTSYRAPTFSPDGERVAVSAFARSCYGDGACENFGIELFDADDLHPLNVRFEGLSMPAAEVMFSPSGELLAAVPPFVFADPFDNIAVWDVDEPAEPVDAAQPPATRSQPL